ncbi:MAG: hypothetical protein ACOY94_07225 [Bacillota bacterium]
MSDLPGGASIPVKFKPGQPLTANDLNEVQRALMLLLLTHTHTGNDQDSPQGALIESEAIAPNAVKGPHISPNAVAKGDIHNGAVGASEIQEKCIDSNHLVDGAVTTAQIEAKAVTLEKLADEVLALLNTPREGATTYAYAAYLDGLIVYPTDTGTWYDWLISETAPVRLHDLPVRRLRDDGGWQPIRSIMPPEQIRPIIPNLDLTTRAEMATSLATILKQNEAVVREVLGDRVAEVRAEGSGWSLTTAAGEKQILADGEVREMLGRLSEAGADLSRAAQPLRTNTLDLSTAFERLAPAPTARQPAERLPIMQPIDRLPIDRLPIERVPLEPLQPIRRLPIDPSLFLDPNPSDDVQERTRTAMLVDPAAINWPVAQEGATLFQPGVGGNAVFSESGQAITFRPDQKPSKEELLAAGRMLYNFGIEADQINPDELLKNPKIYDFLNNPQLLGVGYWTGASRNIRSVTRERRGEQRFVRVRFTVPYSDSSYVVSITPDYQAQAGADGYLPISAHVLRRRAEYVDLLFLRGSTQVNNLAFSIAIHGELVQT